MNITLQQLQERLEKLRQNDADAQILAANLAAQIAANRVPYKIVNIGLKFCLKRNLKQKRNKEKQLWQHIQIMHIIQQHILVLP